MLIGMYHFQDPFSILPKLRVEHLLDEAAKVNVELLFFNATDVNPASRTIEGYIFRNNTWMKEFHPIPFIAINPAVQSLTNLVDQELEFKIRCEIPFVLNLIENKLAVQQKLSHTNLREYLIDAIPLVNLTTFLSELTRHKKVILKPFTEHKGNGIIVISKNSKKQIVFQELASIKTLSFNQACKEINLLVKKHNYFIQPFIYSRTKKGETFHIRIHLMRNSQVEWINISTLVDIADKGIPISNYQGVTSVKGPEFFQENFGKEKGEALCRKVEKLAVEFADQIDSFYNFTVDELGLDFGMDANENIWFYEANTGPEIIAFAEEREREWAMHKIGYAIALTTSIMEIPLAQRRGRHFKATSIK